MSTNSPTPVPSSPPSPTPPPQGLPGNRPMPRRSPSVVSARTVSSSLTNSPIAQRNRSLTGASPLMPAIHMAEGITRSRSQSSNRKSLANQLPTGPTIISTMSVASESSSPKESEIVDPIEDTYAPWSEPSLRMRLLPAAFNKSCLVLSANAMDLTSTFVQT
ncbi:hypothetical protein BC828DRAFT_97702 [Blastocladiella britannica]|nr:hypothetical protein BC828DRAFT_97702 [Blastocladiella britannica]